MLKHSTRRDEDNRPGQAEGLRQRVMRRTSINGPLHGVFTTSELDELFVIIEDKVAAGAAFYEGNLNSCGRR
jgi:hypothetical protein